MSKRKEKKYVITSEQLFDMQKPKFSGFQGGYGAHKNKKAYDRRRDKKVEREEW